MASSIHVVLQQAVVLFGTHLNRDCQVSALEDRIELERIVLGRPVIRTDQATLSDLCLLLLIEVQLSHNALRHLLLALRFEYAHFVDRLAVIVLSLLQLLQEQIINVHAVAADSQVVVARKGSQVIHAVTTEDNVRQLADDVPRQIHAVHRMAALSAPDLTVELLELGERPSALARVLREFVWLFEVHVDAVSDVV